MSIAISEDHLALLETVRRFTAHRCTPAVARAAVDAARRSAEALPPFWDELAALGWLGLHLPEADGGEGYGFAELAVVLEELGRAAAPGPLLPTVWASAAVQRRWRAPASCSTSWPPGAPSARSRSARRWPAQPRPTASIRLSGGTGPVLCGRAGRRRGAAGRRRRRRSGGTSCPRAPCDRHARSSRSTPPGALAELAFDGVGAAAPTTSSRASTGAHVRHLRGRARRRRSARAARLVRGHGRRVRRGAQAVRPAHRPVPGRQAPLRRHARRRRAGPRRGVGRGGGPRRCRGDAADRPAELACRWPPPAPSPSTRSPTWPRTASRCSAASASPGSTTPTSTSGAPSAMRQLLGGPSPWRRATAAGAPSPASAAASRSTCRPRRRRSAPRCGPSPTRSPPCRRRSSEPAWSTPGYFVPHWSPPWGRDARAVEQLVIDEELRRAQHPRAPPGRGRVGGADHRRPRHARAAGALGAADAPRQDLVVPAVQRARGRLRPRGAHHRRPPAPTAAGCSTARRCGPRWPWRPTGASAWSAPTPRHPSTSASPTSSSTCARRASTSARCAR